MVKDKSTRREKTAAKASLPPSGFKVVWREIKKDKVAVGTLIIIIAVSLFIFVGSLFLSKPQIAGVNIVDAYYSWGEAGHIFGTDDGGGGILQLLMMGGRNSIIIGLSVILIVEVVELAIGSVSDYFGGTVGNIIMRIVDFIQILPQMPILIVFAATIPNYNAVTLVLMISLFGWTSSTGYYRSFVLSQRDHEYVLASKTSGSSNLRIIFHEILPSINSMIIIDVILTVVGSVGIETGPSFISYGLPATTSSLGTLVGYADDPANIIIKPWLWVPATILLSVISLSINHVSRVLQRAGDTRQREN